MFSRPKIITFTGSYSDNIERLKREINSADAIVIGAGAGMSTAAGLTYSGERFLKYFRDFHEKYGINDIYSGGFFPFESAEEYWAWWSRHIYYNRYDVEVGKAYLDLLEIVKDKNYFVITTNVDHQFQRAGFDKSRLFYTQGDYGLFQCSVPCHKVTYDNEEIVEKMIEAQKDMLIPAELVPICPKCGRPMTVNLRSDDTFVQDEGWYAAAERYEEFVNKYRERKLLLLELGVGGNTPAIIKYPFLQMTAQNKKAVYACINIDEAFTLNVIEKQSICIEADISRVLCDLKLEDQIARIQKLEQFYDEVLTALHSGQDFPGEDKNMGVKIQELAEYYENGLWLRDYECDERGELPKNLKRGVLSQDGLYHLLSECSFEKI